MEITIPDLVLRFLQYQRSTRRDTKTFKNLKHNSDLCPNLQTQVETILYSLGKFTNIVYDTQGIMDDGSDIIVRYGQNSEEMGSVLAFQVKSYSDLCKPDYMQSLKAQRDDSFRKISGIASYYIMLCTYEKDHKDKIRNIEAEFRTADRTYVVEPSYAHAFLNIVEHRIHAIVTRICEADDVVMKKAIDAIEYPSVSAKALALYLSLQWLKGKHDLSIAELASSSDLADLYLMIQQNEELLDQKPDTKKLAEIDEEEADDTFDLTTREMVFQERLAFDIDILDHGVIDADSSGGTVSVYETHLIPVIALIADSMARYEYSFDDVLPYMLNVMGILDA